MRQIVLTPLRDSLGWMAAVPSLPGCLTEGDTHAEVLAHAQEAMAVYLETLEVKGWDIPPEDGGGIVD